MFSGYAKDGGLYFPERIPKLSTSELEEWSRLTYPQIVEKVMEVFIGEEDLPRPFPLLEYQMVWREGQI